MKRCCFLLKHVHWVFPFIDFAEGFHKFTDQQQQKQEGSNHEQHVYVQHLLFFSFNWFCLNRIQTKMSLSRQIFVHLILCKWKRFNLSPHPLSTISWAASGLVGEDGRSLSRERNPLVPLDFEWGWSHADNRGDNLIVLCGRYKTHSHRIYIYITLLRIYS